jgi:type I restriction enzyme S subunit
MAGNPAIRIRDILSGWTKTYTTESVSDKFYVEHGDILIGMDGIFHMGIWSGQKKALLVQRVCRLRANNKSLQGYLFESLKAPIKYYEQTISGATVAHLGAKHLKEIFILIPDDELLNRLSIFNTFNSETITLNIQNQKLKAARDILLPRLMNRTIEV